MAHNTTLWDWAGLPDDADPDDVPAVLQTLFDSMEGTTNRVAVINKGNFSSIPAFTKWGQFHLDENNVLRVSNGSGWVPVSAPKTWRIPHGFSIDYDVQPNQSPPGFQVSLAASQTSKLASVRYYTEGGTATFKVTRNGADVTGFTGINATTTKSETNPTDVALSEGDLITIVVTAASSCTGLGVTVYTDETV